MLRNIRRAVIGGSGALALLSGGLFLANGSPVAQASTRPVSRIVAAGDLTPKSGWHHSAVVDKAAAQYLGISVATLHQEQAKGMSLAAITTELAKTHPNLTVSGLESAIQAALTQAIQKAQANGKITATEAQARLQKLPARVQALVNRRPHRGHFGLLRPFMQTVDQAAATYLGVSVGTIHQDRQQGQSLAALTESLAAKNPQLTVDGLKSAIQTALNQAIQKAVADGRLTATEADRLTQHLPDVVNMVVNMTPKPGMGPALRGAMKSVDHAVMSYLGISAGVLRQDRAAGMSLAAVAQSVAKTNPKVSVAGLETAITQALTQQISAAEQRHLVTAPEAQHLRQGLAGWVQHLVTMTPPTGGPSVHPLGWGGGMMGTLQSAAASYLGLPTSTLQSDLAAGQSLATITANQAKTNSSLSLTGLENALTTAMTQKIQQAVSANQMTGSQASMLESHMSQMVSHWVTQSPTGASPMMGTW